MSRETGRTKRTSRHQQATCGTKWGRTEEEEEMFMSINPLIPPSVYLKTHLVKKRNTQVLFISACFCITILLLIIIYTYWHITANYYWKLYCYKSVTCKDIAIDDCKKVLFCASCVKTTKKEEPCMFLASHIVFVVFVAYCPAKGSYCQYDMYPHKQTEQKEYIQNWHTSPKAVWIFTVWIYERLLVNM